MDKKAEKLDEKMRESNGNGGQVVEEYELSPPKVRLQTPMISGNRGMVFFFFLQGKRKEY